LDYALAGARQAVSGNAQTPYGEQVLQSLGLSPESAALTYAAIGLAPAGIEAYAANTWAKQASKYNALARASYADFTTQGIKATPEVMASPQAQALIKEIQAANPGMSPQEAGARAIEYITSSASLPQPRTALPGSTLIKVVPAGASPSPTTGYWISPEQARAIAAMSPEQVAQVLGLPASQAAKMLREGMDFYAITVKPGARANVFVSDVASTTQGVIRMPGGAQQVIVPNRGQWTAPTRVNPSTLKSAGGK
jgi:filamentous hemagglutinin